MLNWQSACSSGTCVEAAWVAACANGSCVEAVWIEACSSDCDLEAGCGGDRVLMRDSKNPDKTPITFTIDAWREFCTAAVAWDRDTQRELDTVYLTHAPRSRRGPVCVWGTDTALSECLHFDFDEWDAFTTGINNGLFDPAKLREAATGVPA